ncbi:MAG TPA: hypothetical protein VGQ55_11780 [Pyrinomonadaceae bacterium]|jgi:hypothetical protein|nr:hypothetical protein [Pyrinomonadaceae bacterium]
MRLADILILILFGIIVILSLPILLPVLAFFSLKERFDRVRFRRYLKANEGAKFFAYTNKQTSQEYVEREILPFLQKDIQILFLSGKGRINLGDEHEFIERIVWSMKGAKGGFPYVSEIIDGELVTESINNKLYSAIRRGADSKVIIEKIARFFSLKNESAMSPSKAGSQ